MDNIIYLFRHGEVEYPLNDKGQKLLYGPDVNLSAEGRKGVKLLGNQLLKDRVSIDIFYTSPSLRAIQTADIIAEILGIKTIIQNENLKDTYTPGYTGTPYKDLIAIGGNTYENPRSPDQETIIHISKRMVQAFKKVFNKTKKERILIGIVSHGDPLRILLERLLHPENPLPNPATMRDKDYLEKGTAVRLVLDNNMRVLEHKFINPSKEGKQSLDKKF